MSEMNRPLDLFGAIGYRQSREGCPVLVAVLAKTPGNPNRSESESGSILVVDSRGPILLCSLSLSRCERAQSINRSLKTRNLNGSRTAFGKEVKRSFSSVNSRASLLRFGHYPTKLFGRSSPGFPTSAIHQKLSGKGDNCPFSCARMRFGIVENESPFLQQVVVRLVEQKAPR